MWLLATIALGNKNCHTGGAIDDASGHVSLDNVIFRNDKAMGTDEVAGALGVAGTNGRCFLSRLASVRATDNINGD